MRTVSVEWKCDNCPETAQTENTYRPKGWVQVEIIVEGTVSYWRHFCSELCKDKWLGRAGL